MNPFRCKVCKNGAGSKNTDRYYLIILTIFVTLAAKLAGISLSFVASGSMEPSVGKGDFVLTVPVRKIKTGDIISFVENEYVVTHRVVEIKESTIEKQFITKGDSNKYLDTFPVSEKEIVGKVVFTVPTSVIINIRNIPALYWLMGYSFGLILTALRIQNAPQL